MKIKSLQQILERRKEIEQEIVDMLKETKSDFTLDHVRDAIFHEEDNDDMMKVVAMFDGLTSLTTSRGACPPKPRRRRGDVAELNHVLELVTDAWNYFPHKVLGGISPAEKLLEHQHQLPLYECPECHVKYKEKKWAEKCKSWCKAHHSCNLEITAHAEK